MKTRQFSVYGRVQGVGFRYFTWRVAQQVGVLGTVRNLSDGSVLVVAQGSDSQLEALKNALRQGPKGALVERIIEQPYQGDRVFADFSVRR